MSRMRGHVRDEYLFQGLDVAAFLPTVHGVRSVDTIHRLRLPGIDPELEAQAISKAEIEDTAGVVPIEGAAAEAAGARVVAISATHAIETSHMTLASYCQIRIVADGEGLALVRTSVRHRT